MTRMVTSMRTWVWLALVCGLVVSGCNSGPVGTLCTGDAGCDFGLSAFNPMT